jgi:diguanylate cyclase (GGDEF)-like protein/PAS domain S-box-containing protein
VVFTHAAGRFLSVTAYMALRRPYLPTAGYAVLGSLLLLAFAAAHRHPIAEQLIYDIGDVACVIALAVGLPRRLGRVSRPWQAFGLGVGCWVAGDITYFIAIPSVPDALYLLGYPLFGSTIGAWMISRRERDETALRQVGDAAIVFLAGFSCLWFFGLDTMVDARQPGLDRVLSLAYPILDLVLLSLLVRLVFTSGAWPVAYRLLTSGFGAMVVCDVLWREALLHGQFSVGSWINTFAMLTYVLWGTAALHPSVAQVASFKHAEARKSLSSRRMRLLAAVALVPAIVLLVNHGIARDSEDEIIFAIVVAAIPTLTLARLAGALAELRRTAAAARGAEADLASVIAAAPIPVCVADADGTVRVWNEAAEQVSGYAAFDVVNGPLPLVAPEDPGRVRALYEEALAGVTHRAVEIKLQDRGGTPRDVRLSIAPLCGAERGVVALFEDVTEEHRRAEAVSYLVSHDSLTGLANRRMFAQELERVVGGKRSDDRAALVLIDIDNFKLVNDTGGHPTGDRLLTQLAGTMLTLLRPSDTFARLSGDEFAAVLEQVNTEEAVATATRLLEAAREVRLVTEDGVFDLSISVGLYLLEPGESSARAFQRADEALYEAKLRGKNRMQLWTPAGLGNLMPVRNWSPVIKDALRRNRIELFLQPIVSLTTGQVLAYEALCRLRTANGELVLPGAFLDHAERLGLTPAIDRRMLEQAHELLREHPALTVFVNLSATSVDDDDLCSFLERALQSLEPGQLGIEITEHTSVRDPGRTAAFLTNLRALGALVAIDDFGVGFSSFAQLATIPSDLVKIDARFAHRAKSESRPPDAVAEALNKVAHAYGKQVVAEGIETAAAVEAAAALGIEYGQGWHFGRPAPVREVITEDRVGDAAA